MPVELTTTKTEEPGRKVTGWTVFAWISGFFVLIFVANVIFVWLAVDSWTGLEVESSYKAGQQFQGEMQAAREQANLGWKVDATTARTGDGGMVLRVSALDRSAVPLEGLEFSAHLARPVARHLDKQVQMAETARGRYEAVIPKVEPGQWDLILTAMQNGKRVFRSRNRMVLQ